MFIEESLYTRESIALILIYYSSLTLKLLNLKIIGIKVRNLKEAQKAIKNLPKKDKLATIIKFNKELLQVKDKGNNLLLNQGEIVKASIR